jgi:hypothetical protein
MDLTIGIVIPMIMMALRELYFHCFHRTMLRAFPQTTSSKDIASTSSKT